MKNLDINDYVYLIQKFNSFYKKQTIDVVHMFTSSLHVSIDDEYIVRPINGEGDVILGLVVGNKYEYFVISSEENKFLLLNSTVENVNLIEEIKKLMTIFFNKYGNKSFIRKQKVKTLLDG